MASEHEIDVLNGLIAALATSAAAVGSTPADAEGRDRRLRMLRLRIHGLGAQIVALGGQLDLPGNNGGSLAPELRTSVESGAVESDGESVPSLATLFQEALDDHRLGASTRATIATAWSILEAEFANF